MNVELTRLGQQLIQGPVPEASKVQDTLDMVEHDIARPIGSWVRHPRPLFGESYLYQLLSIDPANLIEWQSCKDDDPDRQLNKIRDYVCTVYGGNAWQFVSDAIKFIQAGDLSILRDIHVVENHCEMDADKTRLTGSTGEDSLLSIVAAHCGLHIRAWVGFSAVKHDELTALGKPVITGLTDKLAQQMAH